MATLRTQFPTKPKPLGLLERLGSLKWVMLALVVFGAGLIVLGAFENGYPASVLLEIGASLFLVVPFFFLERVTTSRINMLQERVESDVESIRQEVQATVGLITDARDKDAAAVQALREHPSPQTAQWLLRRAESLNALSPGGVRVQLPDAELRLRFELSENAENGDARAVRLSLETRDGDRIGRSEDWSGSEPVDQALAALATEAQRAGKYPGDASFDAAAIFERLAGTFDTIISLRTGARTGPPLDPVVELMGDWAITSTGFERVGEHPGIAATELLGERNRLRKSLADDAVGESAKTFSHAFDTAFDYHLGEVRRGSRLPSRS